MYLDICFLVCECMTNQFWNRNLRENYPTPMNRGLRKCSSFLGKAQPGDSESWHATWKCLDTWPGRQQVSRQQTTKWVPKPSTARVPTGWATSKTFHTLGILGDIPRQTTVSEDPKQVHGFREANGNVKTIPNIWEYNRRRFPKE